MNERQEEIVWGEGYRRGKADALKELVRCGECIHWTADKYYCEQFSVGTPEDGFCYMAKRIQQTEQRGESDDQRGQI